MSQACPPQKIRNGNAPMDSREAASRREQCDMMPEKSSAARLQLEKQQTCDTIGELLEAMSLMWCPEAI
jgi:hypothetical protein